MMFKSYLTAARRTLAKHKSHTILNVMGLFTGITCCLLIFQYVSYEHGYDSFENNAKQIVRLRLDEYNQGKLTLQSATVYPIFGPGLKKDFPEIENYCRLCHSRLTLSNDARNARFKEENGYYADTSFLTMFNIQLLKGDAGNALAGPGKILLSESNAKKYFGNTNPIGRQLVYRHAKYTLNFKVTGVFKELPPNCHLAISHLASYPTLYTIAHIYGDTTNMMETSVTLSDFYTYLQLKPNVDIKKLEAKFSGFCAQYINNSAWAKTNKTVDVIHTIPINKIHLYSHYLQEARVNGDGNAVGFIFITGLFIVAIAWINYINFATSRSIERSREIGMRKVLGAKRINIILQFSYESVLLNLMAFVLAAVVAYLLAPAFNALMGEDAAPAFSMSTSYCFYFLLLFAAGTLLSGIYPALILSSYKPLSVLKGRLKNSKGGILTRKCLMVLQFAVSIFLISVTIITFKQVSYMRSSSLGVDIGQTLVLNGAQSVVDSAYYNVFNPFKTELMRNSGIKSVAASYYIPGQENIWSSSVKELSGMLPEVTAYTCLIDYDYIPQFKIKLLAGRNFSLQSPGDAKTVILNDKCLPIVGFKSPEDAINHKIVRNGSDTLTVIGVVQSFHNEGLQKAIQPQIMLLRPNTRWYYSIKLQTPDVSRQIAAIKQLWIKYFPNDPFNYFFLDQYFDKQYRAYTRFGEMFNLFACIAIAIGCTGLLGLSSYNILQRQKEISIRKVLGASAKNIAYLLSKDFIILVLISFLIAMPVGWMIMHQWLQNFAYHIAISWFNFVIAGIFLIAVTTLTISFHVVKTSLAKPAKDLRSE